MAATAGVSVSEAQTNAARRARSTVVTAHGVSTTEASANAVTNSQD